MNNSKKQNLYINFHIYVFLMILIKFIKKGLTKDKLINFIVINFKNKQTIFENYILLENKFFNVNTFFEIPYFKINEKNLISNLESFIKTKKIINIYNNNTVYMLGYIYKNKWYWSNQYDKNNILNFKIINKLIFTYFNHILSRLTYNIFNLISINKIYAYGIKNKNKIFTNTNFIINKTILKKIIKKSLEIYNFDKYFKINIDKFTFYFIMDMDMNKRQIKQKKKRYDNTNYIINLAKQIK